MPVLDDLDEVTRIVGESPEIYLRYSHGPAADDGRPSRDYEAGVDLPGLSVTTIAPEPWWPRPATDWIARRICKYADLAENSEDRQPWLLVGHVVGHGPDHEPLLADVRPLAWIGPRALRQAQELYRERFDVGRDSTGQSH